VTNGSWTTATLSVPRAGLAATSSGNLVFFAGGSSGDLVEEKSFFNEVDIYNMSNGIWSTATLSQGRESFAATSVGSLVMFGGGYCPSNCAGPYYPNVVDIYNVMSGTWTTATLSQGRQNLAATTVASRFVLFAGGYDGSVFSNVVDIYDSLIGVWNTTTLSQARQYIAAASIYNLAFLGGGATNIFGNQSSNLVDIFNATSQAWSTATLSQARYWLAAAAIGDIVAFGGGTDGSTYYSVVDMYSATSNIWFTANLSQPRAYLAATSSTNNIFFGGGYDNSVYSSIVDIFDLIVSQPPFLFSPSAVPLSVPPIPAASTSLTQFPPPLPLTSTPIFLPNVLLLPTPHLSASPFTNIQHLSQNNILLGSILGSVFGSILLVAAIVLIIALMKRKQAKNRQKVRPTNTTTPPVQSRTNEQSVSFSSSVRRIRNIYSFQTSRFSITSL